MFAFSIFRIKFIFFQVSALVGELSNKLQPTRVQPELKREASNVWVPPTKPPGSGKSDNCLFCAKKVYVVERMSAEGKFFHRACFRCDYCNILLRLGISYDNAFLFNIKLMLGLLTLASRVGFQSILNFLVFQAHMFITERGDLLANSFASHTQLKMLLKSTSLRKRLMRSTPRK